MCRVIAVLLLFFASPILADAMLKSYQFGECLGHETICDNDFNEVIILSSMIVVPLPMTSSLTIRTSLRYQPKVDLMAVALTQRTQSSTILGMNSHLR